MNKSWVIVVFLAIFVSSALASETVNAFAGGDGSSGSPYQITNCLELQDMNTNLAASYVLVNDIDCSDTVNWNSGAGFIPVGSNFTISFNGILNGNSHKIIDLYINRPSINYIGLFGYTNNSSIISNVMMENVNIIGNQYVGALIGQANGGIVENCPSSGSIRGYYVGGLIGQNFGAVNNSYSTATIVGINKACGGLIGRSYGIISNSYSTGSVTCPSFFGGLVSTGGGGIVTNSFWNTETSGQSVSGGGTGLTTAQMKTRSTFTGIGWDFINIWQMCPEINDGYPSLKSFGECIQTCIPTAEICDGIDNDCDDIIDNGLTTRPTTCGVGVCAGNTGIETCTAGAWSGNTCDPLSGATAEVCDGLDDDCNELVDDSLVAPSQSCDIGIGACKATGTQEKICNGISGWSDWGTCSAVAGTPSDEICNGLDDNCDGLVDNGLTVPSQSCTVGVGACLATGTQTQTCNGINGWSDWGTCSAVAGTPKKETCNGIDDNCNGVVDENVKKTFYRDQDGDLFGDPSTTIQACSLPEGYVKNSNDMCPLENATGFDADSNGCIDTLGGLKIVITNLPRSTISDTVKKSLLVYVNTAQKYLDRGNEKAAIKTLEDFKSQVNAWKGSKIPRSTANMLITYANNVIAKIRAG